MLNPHSVLVHFARGVGGDWELALELLMFLAMTRDWVSSVYDMTRDWNVPIVMPL